MVVICHHCGHSYLGFCSSKQVIMDGDRREVKYVTDDNNQWIYSPVKAEPWSPVLQ